MNVSHTDGSFGERESITRVTVLASGTDTLSKSHLRIQIGLANAEDSCKDWIVGKGDIMIEVKIDVKLTSDRQLLNTDPVDIFDALAEVFFDDESVTEQDMAADYGIMKIDMDMWVSTNSVEEAFAIGVQAVKAAISAATKQVPWVSAEIDSISAGQLEAA